MNTFFAHLTGGLRSEFLKHQGTFVLRFILLVPVIAAAITFFLTMPSTHNRADVPARWYIVFNYQPYLHIFVFLQILFVSYVNYQEHKYNTWKNLFVLPSPKWVVFVSKAMFAYGILAINVLLFLFLVLLSLYILGILKPELGFQYADYRYEAFVPTVKLFLASTGVFAIMYWISHHFKAILPSIIAGLAGYASAFALFLYTSRREYTGFPYSELHPFNFSGYAFNSFGTGNHSLHMEQVYGGLLGGVFILLIHYLVSLKKNLA